jgi:hypothetical protein
MSERRRQGADMERRRHLAIATVFCVIHVPVITGTVPHAGAGGSETPRAPACGQKERAVAASSQEFREFAQECLRWAGETKSERHRQVLLEMARTWLQGAMEIEGSPEPASLRSARARPAK